MSAAGRLLLVPAPLDFGCDEQVPIESVMPAGTMAQAADLRHWLVENAKSARACLKRIAEHHPLSAPLQAQSIVELPRELHKKGDDGTGFDARALLRPALEGHDLGLMSEAGMPAVADPGASVVRAAHALGIEVLPLVGPSSLLLALVASGLNGQNFAFVGYLPQESAARVQRIRELETLALRTGQSQLFIETPYRNAALLGALLQALSPGTRLSVSSGLTLPAARTRSDTVAGWRERPQAVGGPAVFAIGR
ncbi:SAM-dependent methyltransferase [Ramlibacter rhizophilus]|uniref:Ribosomal RNA small subunit methyltransferase I n=1 Tax=Ramlibacter rhizophilus TaxID=1781167 RepID=A0A4Z0BBJ8_9BURK|nr:SAM-dependent methyltransferase [Ramlibacter rhizophilus]TFY96516.1 ribosomal RNA small subunit methyltransferase I [Ramlibacter rhizophilus]